MEPSDQLDAVIIGAGFGGLSAALSLAQAGRSVALLERLNYPGGCASTFSRDGYEFEAGATLFSGFGEGQLFSRWIERYDLPVEFEQMDPLVELRGPDLRILARRSREALIQQFLDIPGAPQDKLQSFFAYQRKVADALWPLFDLPEQLPPFGPGGLSSHMLRAPKYLPLFWAIGRSLGDILDRFGLIGFSPIKTYVDALCQITLQCSAAEAEAPFALATMDYYHRGTGHVRGGIGRLAWGLVEAIRGLGGQILMATRARGIERDGAQLVVKTKRGPLVARAVIANMLPQDAAQLCGVPLPKHLEPLSKRIDEGWGAVMLYRVVRPPAKASRSPLHLELVDDPERPMTEGNHIFCSISSAEDDPRGQRRMTVSTHVPIRALRALPESERGDYIQKIQDRMRALIEKRAPEWTEVQHELPASPRTFERFTGRSGGRVGGPPRRVGLGNYTSFSPPKVMDGVHLVGDSIFPGQSTLATAVGGQKVAAVVDRALGADQGATVKKATR